VVDSQSKIHNPKSTIPTITSRQNPLVKEIQKIRDDRSSPLIFLEGPRLIQEALLSNYVIEVLVISQQFPETSFLDPIRARAKQHFKVSDQVFQAITDVENPQGFLAIVRRPAWSWNDLRKRSPAPVLILNDLQDPGNTASIVRTAEAAGAGGVITTPKTAHLFSPKAIRGAMGSTFRLPLLEHLTLEEIVKELHAAQYSLIGTEVRKANQSAVVYTKINWKKPWAIVLGQEGQGLSADWEKHLDKRVHIPMAEPVESLNVASSAAILLYESVRQRS